MVTWQHIGRTLAEANRNNNT